LALVLKMRYTYWALIVPFMIITIFGSASASASTAMAQRGTVETNPGQYTGLVSALPNGPDLIIEIINISPQNPSLGDTLTFAATIKNLGNEHAGMSKIDYYVDNNLIFSDIALAVEPGMSIIINATWKAQAGDHIIKAVADADQRIIESNETNNDLTIAFSVLAPNLVVSQITWLPQSSSAQEKVSFNVVIKNKGNGPAPYSVLDFLIGGASQGYQRGQRLDAGANATYSFPWIAQPGSRDIKAVADALNNVIESDETDNAKTVKYSTLTPDLVIQSISWSLTGNLSVGRDLPIITTIKNQGNGTAYSSWVTYYLDGMPLTSAFITPLSANDTVQNTVMWKIESGPHTITAIADSLGGIAESDETNNSKTESMQTIVSDLIVESITWSPSAPLVGQHVTFTVTVKNQGYADISGVTLLQFDVDSLNYYSYIGGINAGARVSATFNAWVAKPDMHILRAVADAENIIVESDESNNMNTTTISPLYPLPPDLLIQNITWSPKNPVIGEKVDFTATVLNQGSGGAGPSSISFYMDDFYLGVASVSPLNSGQTTPINLAWQARGGLHALKAVADSSQIVTERNETDNVFTTSITVLAPDLIIKDASWTPATPSQGDSVTFTITVSNQGTYKANHSSLDYFINDSPRGNHYLEGLEPGAAVTKAFTCIAPSDHFDFKAVADIEDRIPETDETNNTNKITFPAPDKINEIIVSAESKDKKPVPVSDNANATPALSRQDFIASPPGQTGNVSLGKNALPVKIGDTQAVKPPSPFKSEKKIWFNWWLIGTTCLGTITIGAAILLTARLRKSRSPTPASIN